MSLIPKTVQNFYKTPWIRAESLHFGHIRIVCGTELYVVVKTSTKEDKHKEYREKNTTYKCGQNEVNYCALRIFLYCVFMFWIMTLDFVYVNIKSQTSASFFWGKVDLFFPVRKSFPATKIFLSQCYCSNLSLCPVPPLLLFFHSNLALVLSTSYQYVIGFKYEGEHK